MYHALEINLHVKMSDEVREKLCPFCANPNRCGVDLAGGCWCGGIEIPIEMIELLPERGKACICIECVNTYIKDPHDFILNNRTPQL